MPLSIGPISLPLNIPGLNQNSNGANNNSSSNSTPDSTPSSNSSPDTSEPPNEPVGSSESVGSNDSSAATQGNTDAVPASDSGESNGPATPESQESLDVVEISSSNVADTAVQDREGTAVSNNRPVVSHQAQRQVSEQPSVTVDAPVTGTEANAIDSVVVPEDIGFAALDVAGGFDSLFASLYELRSSLLGNEVAKEAVSADLLDQFVVDYLADFASRLDSSSDPSRQSIALSSLTQSGRQLDYQA